MKKKVKKIYITLQFKTNAPSNLGYIGYKWRKVTLLW